MDYRIEKREAFRIVGVKTPLHRDMEKNFRIVPQFWEKVDRTDAIPKLFTLMSGEPKALLGVCVNTGEAAEYYIAVASDQPLPAGYPDFSACTIPAGTWAVFPGRGVMPDAIQQLEKRVITEWLPASGYEYANAPDLEVYLTGDPQDTEFEVWFPVVKQS